MSIERIEKTYVEETHSPERLGMSKKDIVCTLPSRTTAEDMRRFQEVGMTDLRLKPDKMPLKEAILLAKLAQECNVPVIPDLGGWIKPRTLISEGMEQRKFGREKGNWCKTGIVVGQKVVLVRKGVTEEEVRGITSRFGLPENTFTLQMSYLPNLKGDGTEDLNLADGKIEFTVENVCKDTKGDMGAIEVVVESIRDTEGIFWHMGLNSKKAVDLFSGVESVCSDVDVEFLEHLYASGVIPRRFTWSFVSNPKHIQEIIAVVRGAGFDISGEDISAKIETVPVVGVEGEENILDKFEDNVVGIAQLVGEIVAARGDLNDACVRVGIKLADAQERIIRAAERTGTRVIIATNIANSQENKVKEGVPDSRLGGRERNELVYLYRRINGVWLCGETMGTGRGAIDIIRAVGSTMKVAERYWRNPEVWSMGTSENNVM